MKEVDFNLNKRVALITGSGVRIGRTIALCLAKHGARIAVHYRSSQKGAEQTLNEIRNLNSDGILIQADLVDETQANRTVDAVVSMFGRLDILVNNAGSPVKRSRI